MPSETLGHPAYQAQIRIPGYNYPGSRVTVFQAVTVADAAKVLVKANPAWSREDHRNLAEDHQRSWRECGAKWNEVANEAAHSTFGREFLLTDYRISGIAREEFSEGDKKALRDLAGRRGRHMRLAAAHLFAAKNFGRYRV